MPRRIGVPLQDGEDHLPYGALDRRANQLAWWKRRGEQVARAAPARSPVADFVTGVVAHVADA